MRNHDRHLEQKGSTLSEAPMTVKRNVVVDATVTEAFRTFTERFGDFKPKEHNLLGVEIAETVFEIRG